MIKSLLFFIDQSSKKSITFISYRGIDVESNDKEIDYCIFLNRYFTIIFGIFQMYSLSILVLFGLTKDFIALFLISIFFGVFFLFFNKFKRNKLFLSFVFAFLSVLITYYSLYCGLESGVFLFFFTLLSAIPVLYNLKKDKNFVIVITSFILISLYLSAIDEFSPFPENVFAGNYSHQLLILNISCIMLFFILNYLFFDKRLSLYYTDITKNRRKRILIRKLNNEVSRLKKISESKNLSDRDLSEIIEDLSLSDALFVQNFEKFFPDFFQKLNNLSSNSILLSELKLCALLKLGFSTKQIAVYMNSTVKAVEGKKYRIRKKLNLSKDDDTVKWFSAL